VLIETEVKKNERRIFLHESEVIFVGPALNEDLSIKQIVPEPNTGIYSMRGCLMGFTVGPQQMARECRHLLGDAPQRPPSQGL